MSKTCQAVRSLVVVATCCLAIGAVGCGRKGPDVQFVTGVVRLDGEPLEGAIVSFSPREGEGLAAVGTTQGDGRFTLNAAASRPGSGTTTGEYVVLVDKTEYAEFPDIAPDDPLYGTREHDRLIYEAQATPPKWITPRLYAEVDSSPLTAVVERGHNEFVFELVSDSN